VKNIKTDFCKAKASNARTKVHIHNASQSKAELISYNKTLARISIALSQVPSVLWAMLAPYRGPLGQAVEVGAEWCREHVKIKGIYEALQPIADLLDPGRREGTETSVWGVRPSAEEEIFTDTLL
jgi:hypothetical protein